MGKNKLKKFRETAQMDHVIQPEREVLQENRFHLRGKWGAEMFGNGRPIVLELGCGHGDYTVGLAQANPDTNYIGIDIKGARLWRGARYAEDEKLGNVAFLRASIELIEGAFAENEISEIWITFPDPQIKYKRMKHRLTNPDFLDKYRRILKPQGVVHLKCDSEFLHGYTHGIVQMMGCPVYEAYHDIEHQLGKNAPDHLLFAIKTHYEKKWLEQGKAINYLRFGFPND